MVGKGFVTGTAFKKHLDGDWRTVHELWSHIRNYMTSYAQPGGFTQGSVGFAGSDGFLTQDNSNFFYDNANNRLGVGIGAPVCTGHFRGAACADYAGIHPDTILLLENDDNVTLQFQCATTGEARIRFCDDDFNPSAGMIDYEFSGDEMQFGVATSINMYLSTIGLGLGLTATNPLHVAGSGQDEGGINAVNEVVGRFRNTRGATHTAISIDALTGRDPILYLAENGVAIWDIRNDATATDKFQIRYQVGGANTICFQMDNGGNVEILTGYLGIKSSNELRFYDNGNYVGFEAPALAADQIWVLPAVDGAANEVIITDGGGALSWSVALLVPGGEDTTNYNLWLGTNALDSVSVGDAQYNVAIGYDAGTALTTGDGVVAIGFEAGATSTTLGNNVYIGYRAGKGVNSTGQYNVGIGKDVFLDITSGNYNMAFGAFTLQNCQNGSNNVGIGYNAGATLTSGANNIFIGTNSSLYKNKSDTITIGQASGAWDVGLKVVFIGKEACRGVDGANFSESVHIGYRSGYSPAASGVAIYNTAIGTYSMYSMKTAWNTVAIGYRAGYDITSGNNNVLIGREAGENITSGAANVCIGYMAGEGRITTENNQLWIANSDTATPLIYGEFDNAYLLINGTMLVTHSTVGDDGRGLSSIHTLSANPAKSDGIGFYSEGHIGAITTDGPTYGAGIWLNIDAGATLGADVRALDIGIYEAGANCAGGNAYGLAIHLEFDDADPPAAIYPFRINCNDTAGHATPDALIFAPNRSAIALTDAAPGTADAYLKVKLQDGSVYRIPLVKE